jgi:hypothetical protein
MRSQPYVSRYVELTPLFAVSGSTRTVKGNGAVVVIGVRRGGAGRDDGAR